MPSSSTFDVPEIVNAVSWLDSMMPGVGSIPLSNLENNPAYNDLDRAVYMANKFIEKYIDITQTLGYIGALHKMTSYNNTIYQNNVNSLQKVATDIKTNTQKTRIRYMLKRGNALYNEMVTEVLKMSLFLVSFAICAYVFLNEANRTIAIVSVVACGVALIIFAVTKFSSWYDRDKLNPGRIIIRAAKPEDKK